MGDLIKRHKRHPNTWPLKNMKFFAEFMDKTGLTPEAMEAKTGICASVIRRWMRLDNTNLSNVIKIMDSFGYQLSMEFAEDKDESQNIEITIRENVYDGKEMGRLAFLKKALLQRNVCRATLAAELGASRTSVIKWFKNDDIFIKWLFAISEKMGWKLIIKIRPKELVTEKKEVR